VVTHNGNPDQDKSARYLAGYNYTHLYLLIDCIGDSINHRDRAYQNGDGFHLVIANARSGEATGEFYVLKFSPAHPAKNQPAVKGVWYYNIDLSDKVLTNATRFICQSLNGHNYFELLLPWSEVYPYHPLFTPNLGINLCFVKAEGQSDKCYFYLKEDPRIQSELQNREYLPVTFGEPDLPQMSWTQARPNRGHLSAGGDCELQVVSYTPAARRINIGLSIRSADNYTYATSYNQQDLTPGINRYSIKLPLENMGQGGYRVFWRSSDQCEGEQALTLLPEISHEVEKARLNRLKSRISPGDYHTLLFMLDNLVKTVDRLKAYETAGAQREGFAGYHRLVAGVENDSLFLSSNTGIQRRAFLSKVDGTLQPYTVKIPKDFDRSRQWPLFVMLHGSGSDDRHMLNTPLTENNFIEIAPYGRGTSNCFTTDNAETDVREAIKDVIANYPVDTTRIILAGFSMGGYGAYRIFYEYPGMFRGVAVFSGHPNLASRWIGEGHPDFLEPAYLKPFRDIPVFVYHSRNDLNCPYELTRQLVEKLRKAGARVDFVTTESGGHGIIDQGNLPAYFRWLSNCIGR
jgi:predicted esterase